MQLFVNTTNGEIIPLKVEGSDTLDAVKAKIKDVDGCDCDIDWELIPKAKPEKDIKRRKLDAGSKMQLLIRSNRGNIVTVAVRGSDTFEDAKAKLKDVAHECNLDYCLCFPSTTTEMQLLIRTARGKKMTLEFDAFDLVKEKIKESPHECSSLDKCLCFSFTTGEMLLLIRTATGKAMSMDVEWSDKFDLVKAKMKDTIDICHWELIPKPKIWWSESVPIFVRLGKKTITLAVEPLMKICGLFSLIDEEEGIMKYSHNLFFAGMFLEERHTLEHYKIVVGSTLDSVPLGIEDDMEVFIETPDGKKFPLKVGWKIRYIKQIKELIEIYTWIPVDEQRLVYHGEELHNMSSWIDCYIRDKVTLRLLPVDDDDESIKTKSLWIKIHIQISFTHKTIHLDVKTTQTLHDVKSMIQAQEGIPAHQQILFLPRKRLQDDASLTLAACFIQNESTLYLARNLADQLIT